MRSFYVFFFFFTLSATTDIYTLSLHDALPIFRSVFRGVDCSRERVGWRAMRDHYNVHQRRSRIRLAATRSVRSGRSEEHTSELQSHSDLVCRLLLEKKKKKNVN